MVSTGISDSDFTKIEEIMKVSTRLAINRNAYKTNFKKMNEIIKRFEECLND